VLASRTQSAFIGSPSAQSSKPSHPRPSLNQKDQKPAAPMAMFFCKICGSALLNSRKLALRSIPEGELNYDA
jgi:hypothetical protein